MEELIEWTETYRVLEEFAIQLRNLYQDKLIKDNRIASGELLNSVEYIIEKDSRSISVSLQLEDYWIYAEEGRGPGKFPPLNKIREWISIKPVQAVPDEKTGKLPTENQLAFLIGRKIAQEGFEGGHYLAESQEEVLVEFEDRLSEAVGKDVGRYIDILFTQYLY